MVIKVPDSGEMELPDFVAVVRLRGGDAAQTFRRRPCNKALLLEYLLTTGKKKLTLDRVA